MEYSGNVVVNLKKMIEFLRFPVIFLLLRYGSKVRVGEGRFITFYFIIFYTISFFILKKKYESYKSTLTTPHPGPIH